MLLDHFLAPAVNNVSVYRETNLQSCVVSLRSSHVSQGVGPDLSLEASHLGLGHLQGLLQALPLPGPCLPLLGEQVACRVFGCSSPAGRLQGEIWFLKSSLIRIQFLCH